MYEINFSSRSASGQEYYSLESYYFMIAALLYSLTMVGERQNGTEWSYELREFDRCVIFHCITHVNCVCVPSRSSGILKLVIHPFLCVYFIYGLGTFLHLV